MVYTDANWKWTFPWTLSVFIYLCPGRWYIVIELNSSCILISTSYYIIVWKPKVTLCLQLDDWLVINSQPSTISHSQRPLEMIWINSVQKLLALCFKSSKPYTIEDRILNVVINQFTSISFINSLQYALLYFDWETYRSSQSY